MALKDFDVVRQASSAQDSGGAMEFISGIMDFVGSVGGAIGTILLTFGFIAFWGLVIGSIAIAAGWWKPFTRG